MVKVSRTVFVVTVLAVFVPVILWGATRAPVVESAEAGGDIDAEWAASGHANVELAEEDATVDNRAAGTASCARCHAAQGYQVWVEQLKAGKPGNLLGPDGKPATVEYMKSLGLTTGQVKPVTCEACHTDSFELRVSGSTPMLPSGFAAAGVGSGALCMTCHNTRNGLVDWKAADPGRYGAPHHSAQADVIMGQNAYFLDFRTHDFTSPHATFTGDSCVTCHKDMGKGHEFKPQEDQCASCHGPKYAIEMVQAPVKSLLDETAEAFNDRFMDLYAARVASVDAWDPDTDATEVNKPLDGKAIAAVALTGIHGQMGLEIKMADGSSVFSQVAKVNDAAGKPVIPTSDPLVRAGWNYFLVLWDGSYGVHNPAFARSVLTTTTAELRRR